MCVPKCFVRTKGQRHLGLNLLFRSFANYVQRRAANTDVMVESEKFSPACDDTVGIRSARTID
jgi:hypothetical protein